MPTIREGFVFCCVYIYIVYIIPTIGEIFVFCRVFIDIVCIMPTIGYWLYHFDTWIMETHQKIAKILIIHCRRYNIEYQNLQNIFMGKKT